ncbi:hypothetical protein HDU83_002483 [Entophlyctis luteolus]|nr:hypothetical protein HDU82_004025 [Entophlyctis luteolus]KAJ3355835.1 hypothetical protein HDU83_002483 [Entophlyctis luteolus]
MLLDCAPYGDDYEPAPLPTAANDDATAKSPAWPRAKLRWIKQRTLWRAQEYKDVHSIFLVGRSSHSQQQHQQQQQHDGKQPLSVLPPIVPKSMRENNIAIDPKSYQLATNALYSSHAFTSPEKKHQYLHSFGGNPGDTSTSGNQALFDRLSRPKCPGTPPLPAECTLQHQSHSHRVVDQNLFERLYQDRPAVRHAKIAEEEAAQRLALVNHHRSIEKKDIDRLARPKVVQKPSADACNDCLMPCIGTGKVDNVQELVNRLSKPRYYIVWRHQNRHHHNHHYHHQQPHEESHEDQQQEQEHLGVDYEDNYEEDLG